MGKAQLQPPVAALTPPGLSIISHIGPVLGYCTPQHPGSLGVEGVCVSSPPKRVGTPAN